MGIWDVALVLLSNGVDFGKILVLVGGDGVQSDRSALRIS